MPTSNTAPWIIAEALELQINGYTPEIPIPFGSGYMATAADPNQPQNQVAVFTWLKNSVTRRMLAFSEQVAFPISASDAQTITDLAGASLKKERSFTEWLVATHSASDASAPGFAAVIRQTGRGDFKLVVGTSKGEQSIDIKPFDKLTGAGLRRAAKACAKSIWSDEFQANWIAVGPAGLCAIEENGWRLAASDVFGETGLQTSVKLHRDAFNEWELLTGDLLPSTLNSNQKRRTLDSTQMQELAGIIVSRWESLQDLKPDQRWQAHPLGLMIEMANRAQKPISQ